MNILLVEDNDGVADSMGHAFELRGHTMTLAVRVASARHYLATVQEADGALVWHVFEKT